MKEEKKMIANAKAESTVKCIRSMATVLILLKRGEPITVKTVADRAGVSRKFFYRHPDIGQVIRDLWVSGMSKKELQQEIARLRMELAHMRKKRSEAHE